MEVLTELVTVCRAADTDKITERKKQIDKLKLLLGKAYIIKALDNCSDAKRDGKDKKMFGWDSLFKVVKNLIWREADCLKKAKDSQSAANHKKKQEICGLLKLVVKLANKSGHRLKGSDVAHHVMRMMQDDFARPLFGTDHCAVLLKEVLPVHKYWCQLDTKTWQALLELFCGMLVRNPAGIDRLLIARIIHRTIDGAIQQCDIRPKEILPLFEAYLQKIKQEKTIAVMENVLRSVNKLCRAIAVDSRVQICHFGEVVFIHLLHIWSNRPSEKLKEELTEFFQLQMVAHYPQGALDTQHGAFAVDAELWKSNLRKLYEAIYNDLQDLKSRTRFSNREQATLSESFADLSADICHQLFVERTTAVDVTQFTQSTGGAAKKRRIESGWGLLRDEINQHASTYAAIPWLQLLQKLVHKYPVSIPDEEFQPLLATLQQVYMDSKKAEVTKFTIYCLESMSRAQTLLAEELSQHTVDMCQGIWQKIWTTSLRIISLRHAESEGFGLLSSLLCQELVSPDKEVWSLFIPGVHKPSEPAVRFLHTYLGYFELPEKYVPRSLVVDAESGSGKDSKFPLRRQLLLWMLPKRDSDLEECHFKVTAELMDPMLLAEVLVILTLRNTGINSFELNTTSDPKDILSHMEDVYLKTSFDKTLISGRSQHKRNTNHKEASSIPHLQNILHEFLEHDINELLENSETELTQLLSLISGACLVSGLMSTFVKYHIMTVTQLSHSPLCSFFKKLLKRFCSLFTDCIKKEFTSKTLVLLQKLKVLFDWNFNFTDPESDGTSSHQLAALFRSLVPPRLIDSVLDIALDKIKKRKPGSFSADASSSSRTLSRKPSVMSAFDDLDFDMGTTNTEVNDLDDFDSSRLESQESSQGSSQGHSRAFESLFSKSQLTDSEEHRLASVDILCAYCKYNDSSCNENNNYQQDNQPVLAADVDPDLVSRKLMDLLDPDLNEWEPSRAFDLQLLRCMVCGMCSPSRSVSDDEILTLQDAITSVCKTHRKDQDICGVMLRLVTMVIPHLQADSEMITRGKREARDTAVQLHGAFWKMTLDKQYMKETRKNLADCMRAFIQVDPDCEWTSRSTQNQDGETQTHTIKDQFSHLLEDRHQAIRLQAAQEIECLFTTRPSRHPLPRSDQDAAFADIFTILQDVINIEFDVLQDPLSPDEQKDEMKNRTSSLLHTLCNVACSSSACEKKSIFAICQMTKEHNFEVTLVQKVLRQIAHHHGYSSIRPYMDNHMSYLLHHWHDNGYKMEEFPCQLNDIKHQKEFFNAHIKTIIPLLVVRKDTASLDCLQRSLGTEWCPLVKDCIPQILVHILPLFAAGKLAENAAQRDIQRKVSQANSSYEFLTKVVKEEVIQRCIITNLEDIVVLTLMTFWDTDDSLSESTRLLRHCPEPSPPHYDTATIRATLDYLTDGLSTPAKSLVSYLSKSQDSIQKILLSLAVHLSESHRMADKYRLLFMYQLFVQLLLKEFSEQLGGNWAFVLQDIIYTLLRILGAIPIDNVYELGVFESAVVCFSLRLLHMVAQAAVESCPDELGRFLAVIIGTLIPLESLGRDIQQQAVTLIKFLIVDNYKALGSSIKLLKPFPDKAAFDTANQIWKKLKYKEGKLSVKEEIENFLKSTKQKSAGGSLNKQHEMLEFFNKQHSVEKSQLLELLQTSEDDPSVSTLAEFIYKLLKLAKSPDREEAQLAGRCLGEIGPVNLPIITVKEVPDNASLQVALLVYKDNNKMQQYCWVFHLLSEYLTDFSMETVVAAGKVLKQVLGTKKGIEFYQQYKSRVADHLFQYLHPFKSSKKMVTNSAVPTPTSDEFRRAIDSDTLWLPSHKDNNVWLRLLVCKLINSGGVSDEILRLLEPICKVKVEMCQTVLPYIIHDILVHNDDVTYHDVLTKHFNQFFKKHCEGYQKGANVQCNISQNCDSVKTMLKVVLYLRQQDKPQVGRRPTTAWCNNFWLDLDYLPLAQAAHNCTSHFTALLFSEIWCDVEREKLQLVGITQGDSEGSRSSQGGASQALTQGSQLEALGALPNTVNINVQSLMLESYRCVGDPDAMYGCGAGRLSDAVSRIKTYEHEDNWYKALGSYDLEMSGHAVGGVGDPQTGLLQALQNCGCSHVLDMYLQGLSQQSPGGTAAVKDLQFEAAWRHTNWTLDTPARMDAGVSFNQALYTNLAALRDNDQHLASQALQAARLECVSAVSVSSLACVRNVYPTLSKLHCVTQAEDVLHVLSRKHSVSDLLTKWESQDVLLQNDFQIVEPILTQRCVLFEVLQKLNSQGSEVRRGLVTLCECLARKAREAGRMQIAERAIHKLRFLDAQQEADKSWCWHMEEAWMFWSRGECDTAKHLMKNLIRKLEKLQDESMEAARLYPKCLGVYGNWLAETRSENPNTVMEQYLKKATDLLEMVGPGDEAALDAFLSLGRYSDAQYQHIVDYMKSSTYEAKQALVKKAKEDAQDLRNVGDKTSRYLRILEKQHCIDEQELVAMQQDRSSFLESALRNYLKCLQCGDRHDLRVFRLTSLWFDNSAEADVNKQLKSGLPQIKSYKFLSLMYQLAARMYKDPQCTKDLFKETLDKLIERTVLDHPHHTLPIILALANANKDLEILQSRGGRKSTGRLSRGSSEQSSQNDNEEDRVQAAKIMLESLQKSGRAKILDDMERLSLAYIQMANWNVDKYKQETRPITIPSGVWLIQLKNLTNAAVPTVETKIDPTCEYKDIVYVVKFQPTFKLAGGINLPKIISCVGSDGISRRQLVKGKDDLRQDAVMQQVFGMVNNLLIKDPESRKRRLTIRTYKVIPLSQRSGLLEWCEGTVPMGDYLIAPQKGAHPRYRPQDYTAKECRTEITDVHKVRSLDDQYKIFLKVCKRFKPVFRHFFMEKFPDPADWYERRLAYTHSVATNSIVGYILGLGDRHVQNILIDTKTAEMVHIDLGVAFEQGRILPTPETVPFRLTNDVVDGMGIAGVEGVFRRCCEKTMEVMRGSHEALLTILQVLLYDPLYAWTISPEKAYLLQHRRAINAEQDGGGDANTTAGDILDIEHSKKDETAENVNRVAERVLLRLQQKLQGVEDGIPLSVSGQVNLLIQEARDPKNLSRVFPGWQPYI